MVSQLDTETETSAETSENSRPRLSTSGLVSVKSPVTCQVQLQTVFYVLSFFSLARPGVQANSVRMNSMPHVSSNGWNDTRKTASALLHI